jgi:cellulose synthase/poly-beta-1,6-N-acetylglucosamine synthase-like glycosyltransferase
MPPIPGLYQDYLNYHIVIENSILIYFLAVNGVYVILYIAAFFAIMRRQQKIEAEHIEFLLQSEDPPSIAFIVPAYNEELNIVHCIQTLLNLYYRNKEIIIVNDGSTDKTLKIMQEAYHLKRVHLNQPEKIKTEPIRKLYQSLDHPNLFVVDKFNGGRADALSAGLNVCKTHYFFATDADCLVSSDEMNMLLRYMISRTGLAASGASIRPANGCEIGLRGIASVKFPQEYLASIQVVEYLRAFLVGRMGWAPFGGSMTVAGACSFYEVETVKNIGGYVPEMLGEDLDLTIRYKVHRYNAHENPYTEFIPEPVVWTEVPSSWKSLGEQRTRWHLGLIQAMWKHKRVLFNPRYGWQGMFMFPFYLFAETFGPIVEFAGYFLIVFDWVMGISSPYYIVLFIMLTVGFAWLLNLFCLLLEQISFRFYTSPSDITKFLFYSFMENFGYRQMHVLWRLRGFWRAMTQPIKWKATERAGFEKIRKSNTDNPA